MMIWIAFIFCVWIAVTNGDVNQTLINEIEQSQNDPKPPHVILIISDDQGWNDISWHNEAVLTPNLDRLAKNGAKLENAYVQPIGTQTRASIMTGKYPYRLGLQWLNILNNQPKFLPRNETLLPQKMKEAGYSTHMVGKWHLGHCAKDLLPTSRGFDSFYGILRGSEDYYNRTGDGGYDFWKNNTVYFPPNGAYNTDLFTDEAVKILKSHDQGSNPVFLTLAYTAPHAPLQVSNELKDLYPGFADSDRQAYLGLVSSLDQAVGKVIDALEIHNYINNTVVIFLSDNGGDTAFGGSNLPLRGGKGNLWEGGTKSVGFVYSPLMVEKGCEHYGMIHAVDWFSTILEIANHSEAHDVDVDGVSQWNYLLRCRGSARKEFIYNIDDDVSNSAAIRVDNFKLITGDPHVYEGVSPDYRAINPNNTDVRLYNLDLDPDETTDIAKQHINTVAMMTNMLNDYRELSIPAQNQELVSPEVSQPGGVARPGWC